MTCPVCGHPDRNPAEIILGLAEDARETAARYPVIAKVPPEFAGLVPSSQAAAYELAVKIIRGEVDGQGIAP